MLGCMVVCGVRGVEVLPTPVILNLVQHDSGAVLAELVSALVWLAIATSFVLAMTGQARHLPRSLGFDDFAREMGVSSGRHWMTLLGKLGVGGWVVSPSAWRFSIGSPGRRNSCRTRAGRVPAGSFGFDDPLTGLRMYFARDVGCWLDVTFGGGVLGYFTRC